MNVVLKTLFCFIFVFFVSNSEAVIVLKTKNKQALIHLEGLKTKRGAYFETVDLYGKRRGIVQIKRVARTKAIGVLQYGRMAKRWSLEPTSRKRAVAIQKNTKRRSVRIARIQKEKIKRKLGKLAQKNPRRLKNKRLVHKKTASRRGIASYEKRQGEYITDDFSKDSKGEYIINDFPKDSNPSQEVLSYDSDYSSARSFSGSPEGTDQARYLNPQADYADELIDLKSPKQLSLGLAPRIEYNVMKIIPPRNQPEYLMSGFGYGLFAFADFPLNHFIGAGVSLGGKYFSVSAEEQKCGKKGGCSLSIYYFSAGLSLKLNLIEFYNHKFWLAGEGVLMLPLLPSNNILEEESFSPFHGTLGGNLGIDFTLGNFVIPVSIGGAVYLPTTKTTLTGSAGFQLGLAYKF